MSNTPKQTQAEPNSLIARLRAKRLELQQARTLELEVPGWGGLLAVRYQAISWPEMRTISERADKAQKRGDPSAELMLSVDLVLAATDCILIEGDDGLAPYGTPPLGFDAGLAELLGLEDIDPTNAQAVVLATFPNEMSLMKQGGEITEWLTYEDSRANEALGKASSGTE